MDSISIYWPFWPPVSLWPAKPPQNETKLKNIISETYRRSKLPQNHPLIYWRPKPPQNTRGQVLEIVEAK
jgi:hypothetical protein